jgi:hypothetical protein
MNDAQRLDSKALLETAKRMIGSGISANNGDATVTGEILKTREPKSFDILIALYPGTLRYGHSARDIEAVAWGIERGMFNEQPLPRWSR